MRFSNALAAASLASLAWATVPTGGVSESDSTHLAAHPPPPKAGSARKSLNFGPVHPHASFRGGDDAFPHGSPVSFAAIQSSEHKAASPLEVAKRLADKLAGPDIEYFVREDSYTDDHTGVTHLFVRQLVNGIEVSDADVNINVDRHGRVLSYGDSFYRGAVPAPGSNPIHHSEEKQRHSSRCAALKTKILDKLSSLQADVGHEEASAALGTSYGVIGHLGQIVFDSLRHGLSSALGTLKEELAPLQSELYQLCEEADDSPLLHGLEIAGKEAKKIVDVLGNAHTRIIDPRIAVVGFLAQASPDEGLVARLTEDLDSAVESIRSTFEHHLHGKHHSQVTELLHNVPSAMSPVKARLAYIQHPHPEDPSRSELNLVWRFELEMEDNWYEVYVDATRPGQTSAVVDWASDAPSHLVEELDKRKNADKKQGKDDEGRTSYYVFKWGINDPEEGHRSFEVDPYDKVASPLGWHTIPGSSHPWSDILPSKNGTTFNDTRGNNVFAQANPDGGFQWLNNHRPEADHGVFDFKLGWRKADKKHSMTPAPEDYINASVTQLFYTTNQIHDFAYRYGFTEKTGNFQEHNFGRGGIGGDALQANAQDGAAVGRANNANMMTPPDGQRPRMNMYQWDGSTPYRDGDLEAGIVIHEYTHGISTRLTGGPANSGCLGWGEAGGMGEGWGDYLATQIRKHTSNSTDYPMGAWASDHKGGIRGYPYSTNFSHNPETYKSIDKYFGVHQIGQVWAEILFEVTEQLIAKHGHNPSLFPPALDEDGVLDPLNEFYLPASSLDKDAPRIPRHGNTLSVQLVITGMKLQPCRPDFLAARDAIIQADEALTGGNNTCALWKGFSKRGLGPDAEVVGRSPWGGGLRTDDFALPKKCKSKKH